MAHYPASMIFLRALRPRSAPAQLQVLVYLLMAIVLVAGGVMLYFGYTASPEHAEESDRLIGRGWQTIGLAFVAWGIYRLCFFFVDRLLG